MVFTLGLMVCAGRQLFSKTVFRKISSPASQIGAALLFDVGKVDRRLVGPDKKANDRHGVFRVNNDRHPTLFARRRVAPRSREIGIKAATKRAASEALAQMPAMAAMPVIAGIAFWRW